MVPFLDFFLGGGGGWGGGGPEMSKTLRVPYASDGLVHCCIVVS